MKVCVFDESASSHSCSTIRAVAVCNANKNDYLHSEIQRATPLQHANRQQWKSWRRRAQQIELWTSVSVAWTPIDDNNFTFVTCGCRSAIIVNHPVMFVSLHTDRLIKIGNGKEFLHSIPILLANAIVACHKWMHECWFQLHHRCSDHKPIGSPRCYWTSSVRQRHSRFDWIVSANTIELCHLRIRFHFICTNSCVSSVCHPFRMLLPTCTIAGSMPDSAAFSVSVLHFSTSAIGGQHRGVRDTHILVAFVCLT